METPKVLRLKARVKELQAVIRRLSEIHSEEYGDGETEYEAELNHLFMKRTLFDDQNQKCSLCDYAKHFHNKRLRYDKKLYCPDNTGNGFKAS